MPQYRKGINRKDPGDTYIGYRIDSTPLPGEGGVEHTGKVIVFDGNNSETGEKMRDMILLFIQGNSMLLDANNFAALQTVVDLAEEATFEDGDQDAIDRIKLIIAGVK